MRLDSSPLPRRGGFSSLEVMISILLFMSLFAVMGTSASSVNGQLRESNFTVRTEEAARSALDHILRELRGSARGTALPGEPEPSNSISYQVVEGWSNGAATLSPPKTLSFVGDTIQLDGTTLIAGLESVDFSRTGNLLTVRVTAQKPLGDQDFVSTQWVAHVAN